MREVKIDFTLTLNFDGRLYSFRQYHGIPVLQMYNFETSESRFYIDLLCQNLQVVPITTKIIDRKVISATCHSITDCPEFHIDHLQCTVVKLKRQIRVLSKSIAPR